MAVSDSARSEWSAGGGWADSNRAFDMDEDAQADAAEAAKERRGLERALWAGLAAPGQLRPPGSSGRGRAATADSGQPRASALVLPRDVRGGAHPHPLPRAGLVSPGLSNGASSAGTLQQNDIDFAEAASGAGVGRSGLFPSMTPSSAGANPLPFEAGTRSGASARGNARGSAGGGTPGQRRQALSSQDWRMTALRAATAQAEARAGPGSTLHAAAARRETLAVVRAQTAGMAQQPLQRGQEAGLADGRTRGPEGLVSRPRGGMVSSYAGMYGYPTTPHAVDHEALAVADRQRAAEMEAIARVDPLRVSVVREQWDKVAPGYSVASQLWLVNNVVELVFSFLEEPREVYFDDDRMRDMEGNSFSTRNTMEQVQAAAAGGPGVDRRLTNTNGKMHLGKTKAALMQFEASLHGGFPLGLGRDA